MDREKYCPNMIIDTPDVSIGEFKTLSECMSFPITERWCINRKNGNKFDKYKSQGNRILIICCWNRNDAWRFVVAIIKNGIKYFDLNDLPMDLVSDRFEEYLGEDIVNKIHSINNLTNNNEIKENITMKKTIKLNERELHRLISESVKRVLNEGKITVTNSIGEPYGTEEYYEGDTDYYDDNWDAGHAPTPYFGDDADREEILYALRNAGLEYEIYNNKCIVPFVVQKRQIPAAVNRHSWSWTNVFEDYYKGMTRKVFPNFSFKEYNDHFEITPKNKK